MTKSNKELCFILLKKWIEDEQSNNEKRLLDIIEKNDLMLNDIKAFINILSEFLQN